ncbi:NF038396 family protein [Neomicrococcus aestuarii]|uniref:Integral membrane protein n=1 Tax=Neomicrococcus aestuarii TaxID=556325 RepID=A0A1L2ZR25_9MICC|nr:NF038396 family protein [Neomicrococcus aestuarii]APF41462.1 hypothetical protein BHE16_11260 [Neomicrococcus aestuarii]
MKEAFRELSRRPDILFVLGYMLFPLLALICAGLGLWMVLTGQRIAGLIVLLVVTQVFAFSAFWAINQRRKALELEQSTKEDPAA